MSEPAKNRIVGTSVPRKEGVDKLRGTARYIDDIQREGMWHGATVRSAVPRGLIRSIGFHRNIDWSEFTVATAADIPGENRIQMIVADQPCLADGQVNHCEEAILLIAHPDKHKVREAANAVAAQTRVKERMHFMGSTSSGGTESFRVPMLGPGYNVYRA